MRAIIANRIAAARTRRDESGQGGFSVTELIVAVAILGVLVAIAIPVLAMIQQTAKDNALKSAAENVADLVAAQVASKQDVSTDDLSEGATIVFTIAPDDVDSSNIDDLCVTAAAMEGSSMYGATDQEAGPGC